MHWRGFGVAALLWTLSLGNAAVADCAERDAPCETDLGEYHIAVPDGPGPHPAVVFLHGYGGTAAGTMRMADRMTARGYALIAPQGLKPEGARATTWSFRPGGRKFRNEAAFMRSVIADAANRFAIDPDRVLLSGFSIGGSTTTYIACENPSIARGYAPVAGGFWRPHPALDGCAGPVNLLHTHGWRDKTVPLEGRPLRSGTILQGDIFVTLQIWREANGCQQMRADEFTSDDTYWRRKWTSCAAGALEFALHPGAHGIPLGWTDMALDWFEGL